MLGIYKKEDIYRPVHECYYKKLLKRAIIIQITNKSYLVRFNERISLNGQQIWYSAKWIKKDSLILLKKIGYFIPDYFRYSSYGKKEKLHKTRLICPECNGIHILNRNIPSGWYYECPNCLRALKKEKFKIIYDFEHIPEPIPTEESILKKEKPKIKLKVYKCPVCNSRNKDISDDINGIIKCSSCNVYYTIISENEK